MRDSSGCAPPRQPGRDAGPLDTKETARVEAFSDGVFAIAITLLVLEIKVPPPETLYQAGGGALGLLVALRQLWPSYLGYAISFVTIGDFWANHHHMFKYIRRSDHPFVMLNVLLLLFIAFLPFPTAVLAEYLTQPGARVTAVVFFVASLTATALVYNAVWWYAASGRRLLSEHAEPGMVRTITRRYAFGLAAYVVATALGFASIPASLAICAALVLLYMLPYQPAVVEF